METVLPLMSDGTERSTSWLPELSKVTGTVRDAPQVGLRGSEKRRSRVSPGSGLPSTPPPSLSEVNTGPAPSDGVRTNGAVPVQPVNATVKGPTAVSGGPAPSVIASVATEPARVTPANEPPDGTWARDHPEVHDPCRAPENVTSTLSIRPSWSMSAVWAATTGFIPGPVVVVVAGPVVVV